MENVNTTKVAAPTADDKVAKAKEAKKEAAKKFKERRAAEKAERIAKSKKLIESLKKQGLFDKLSADEKAFLEGLANPAVSNVGSASLFTVIFGATPKAGDSKTLMDIFKLTQKGKAQIDAKVKEWAAQGKVVTYKADSSNILNSTYTIEKC